MTEYARFISTQKRLETMRRKNAQKYAQPEYKISSSTQRTYNYITKGMNLTNREIELVN